MAFAAPGTIDWFTSSDQNVLDFWTNVVKPKFEAANPGVTLNLVDGQDNAGLQAIAERALAALGTNADPQVDIFEGFDSRQPVGAREKGLYADVTGLSNYSKINPLAIQLDGLPENLPYRGSQVLLAFDTTKLKPEDAPKTWDALVAWIKANPGQFIYNRPNKGGSGGNFVRRAIYAANANDIGKFKVDNFTAEAGAAALDPAWAMLNDLAPSLF
jgi:putative spermidine/putrescine transport system substrate-binding protein